MTKACSQCGVVKPRSEFYRAPSKGPLSVKAACKVCTCANQSKHRKDNPAYHSELWSERSKAPRVRKANRDSTNAWRAKMRAEGKMSLLRQMYLYKLTPKDFEALCARDPICPICKRADKPLVTDHNHITDKVRGRLCTNCNTALGKFGDSEEMLTRAIEYLKERN